MSTGTVTISLAEWTQHTVKNEQLVAEVADLSARLKAAESADPAGSILLLASGMRAARWLAALAMQYPAKRWPVDELRAYANVLRTMPGADDNDTLAAIDMIKFCDEMIEKQAIQKRVPVAGPGLDPNIDHSPGLA